VEVGAKLTPILMPNSDACQKVQWGWLQLGLSVNIILLLP